MKNKPSKPISLAKALRVETGDVVAFTGGGGKTTAMFQLANELAGERRVLTTTSTRIFAAQISRSPVHLTFDPDRQRLPKILPRLAAAIDQHGQALLIGQADRSSGKAFGLPPEVIDALAATGQFDVILNEADGSRMRPFKAPAEHEPVIPVSTTIVVPVAGLDILNRPLSDEFVHRAERVSRLSGTPLAAPVGIDTLVQVLGHAQGGLKNVPPQARVLPLLNKAEDEQRQAAAQTIAARLLATCPRIEAVIIGAVQQTGRPVREVHSRTAAVVLAAGGSSRFGSPKQLASWGDKTLLTHAVDVALASQAEPVLVVLGAAAEQCRRALGERPVNLVINEQWAAGQSTSMQAGLAAVPKGSSGAIFLLVDVPRITVDTVDKLIARHRQTLAPVVWPEFEGQRGNPVLFDRATFSALAQVSGDTGGRAVLQAYQTQAERVAVSDPGILLDVDRPDDLQRIGASLPKE